MTDFTISLETETVFWAPLKQRFHVHDLVVHKPDEVGRAEWRLGSSAEKSLR